MGTASSNGRAEVSDREGASLVIDAVNELDQTMTLGFWRQKNGLPPVSPKGVQAKLGFLAEGASREPRSLIRVLVRRPPGEQTLPIGVPRRIRPRSLH
jgi:hypothetical protein